MSQSETETVHTMAELARLDISAREAEALGAQFARILEQFQVLARLDVEGVEPMTGAGQLSDVQREDEPRPSSDKDAILANAPQRSGDFYAVPKTVGGQE